MSTEDEYQKLAEMARERTLAIIFRRGREFELSMYPSIALRYIRGVYGYDALMSDFDWNLLVGEIEEALPIKLSVRDITRILTEMAEGERNPTIGHPHGLQDPCACATPHVRTAINRNTKTAQVPPNT